MYNSAVFRERVSCSYSQWQPREIVCEANYMEVSSGGDYPAAALNVEGVSGENWRQEPRLTAEGLKLLDKIVQYSHAILKFIHFIQNLSRTCVYTEEEWYKLKLLQAFNPDLFPWNRLFL